VNFSGTLSILTVAATGSTCGIGYVGVPLVYTGTLQGASVTYTETLIVACHVIYHHGHLNYVDTATSDTFDLSDGRHCAAPGPFTLDSFTGAYSSRVSISGTFYRAYSQANCQDHTYIYHGAVTGTWSGSS
jgi:hypothetical protein